VSVRTLSSHEADAATAVLSEAFHDYPVMRWVLKDSRDDYDRRLRRLVRFFVDARLVRGEPLLGVEGAAGIEAVAMVSYPDGPASPPELFVERDALWKDLGAEARARYEAFGDAFSPLLPAEAHVHLNMLGTRESARGKGHGRTLLETVHGHSAAHPRSCGVSLTTEVASNVPLYRHFGYAVIGRAHVAEGIDTWVFFRPDGA